MKNIKKLFFCLVFTLFVFIPTLTFAHNPVTVTSNEIIVTDPEISKAYYAELTGKPHIYYIKSDEPFNLYVNLLVPDIKDQKKDTIAQILKINKDINTEIVLTSLEGTGYKWTNYFEPFGSDKYWKGPEFKIRAEAGEYEIRVRSPQFDGKYALAIGEAESFGLEETIGSIDKIIKNKKEFFGKSPISFIFSPIGFGYIIVMFLFAFITGFVYRLIIKKINKNKIRGVVKNINKKDRIIRVILGLALLILAITTTWNPILFFFAGFCFFEAIFSWCGLYAALGKNTCPVE